MQLGFETHKFRTNRTNDLRGPTRASRPPRAALSIERVLDRNHAIFLLRGPEFDSGVNDANFYIRCGPDVHAPSAAHAADVVIQVTSSCNKVRRKGPHHKCEKKGGVLGGFLVIGEETCRKWGKYSPPGSAGLLLISRIPALVAHGLSVGSPSSS